MSTEVTKAKKEELIPQAQNRLPQAVIAAQLYNNWKGTSEEQRVKACLELCNVLGIPTPMNPFRFIELNGRLVLYAPNEAAQLIAQSRKASVKIINKYLDKEFNIYIVEVRVIDGGREVDNLAGIFVGGLTGQKRADAMMKCVTKAQRRTIFGAFGLSVADDDDIDFSKVNSGLPTQPEVTSSVPAQLPLVAETKAEGSTPLTVGEPIDLPPPPLVDEETETAKIAIFQKLIGKNGLYAKDPKAAKQFIADVVGKEFDKIDANDCQDLEAAIKKLEVAETAVRS